MPQFDTYIFSSSLFFFIIGFVILLFFYFNLFLPRLGSVLKLRSKYLKKNLSKVILEPKLNLSIFNYLSI